MRSPIARTFACCSVVSWPAFFSLAISPDSTFRWAFSVSDSVSAAQCGIAAQQQNALFQYQDLWYRNQQDENTDYATPAFCDGIAKSLGLDMAKFQKDREDEAIWAPEIQDVQVVAAQENFGGTPSFIIEGPKGRKVLSGSLPGIKEITDAVKAVQ